MRIVERIDQVGNVAVEIVPLQNASATEVVRVLLGGAPSCEAWRLLLPIVLPDGSAASEDTRAECKSVRPTGGQTACAQEPPYTLSHAAFARVKSALLAPAMTASTFMSRARSFIKP
jgi:hypothetical protein